eukprot:scaffold1053_cov107-Isochrysis_galbana.AAC.16
MYAAGGEGGAGRFCRSALHDAHAHVAGGRARGWRLQPSQRPSSLELRHFCCAQLFSTLLPRRLCAGLVLRAFLSSAFCYSPCRATRRAVHCALAAHDACCSLSSPAFLAVCGAVCALCTWTPVPYYAVTTGCLSLIRLI